MVDEIANRQNDRVLACDPSTVPPVLQSKNPTSVMVFGAVASDGLVMPPHFIKAGLRIGAKEYLDILENILMPWIHQHYNPQQVMFVQDSAPALKSALVQKFLSQELPLFVPEKVWPSGSPDLNPCDFWLWGTLLVKTNASQHANIGSLKSSITKACKACKVDDAKAACTERIVAIMEAEGGHIE